MHHVMIPISKALKIVDREIPKLGSEKARLDDAVGRVLAENIVADMDLPPFDRSQMDGYAVKSADTVAAPVTLKIVGESAAGRGWSGKLKNGEAVRIMTGAPVPAGADAVQRLELAEERGGFVAVLEPVAVEKFIVPRGSETRKGKKVLSAGTVVDANMVATLAAFGYAKVKVARQPRVAVLATGSEIVEVTRKPKSDQIRNSNSAMLAAMLREIGIEAEILPRVPDDLTGLTASFIAAAKKADIVVITGGVSVGKYDLTKAALTEIGADIHFDKIELRPGKPTVFASRKKTCFFGLPGNPVSVAVTFALFVRRAILHMQSAAETTLAAGFAVLETPAKAAKERDTYLPATLATSADGQLLAVPLKWGGSSDFVGYSAADALAIVPKGKSYAAGDVAEIVFL
jgi:molybdopterin molybdotransferase